MSYFHNSNSMLTHIHNIHNITTDSCHLSNPENHHAKSNIRHHLTMRSQFATVMTQVDIEQIFIKSKITKDQLRNVKNVLDIGCGDGRIITWLVSNYRNIESAVGIDFVSARIEIAKNRVTNLGLQNIIKFVCIDIRSYFPYLSNNQYDLIIITEVLEHFEDPYKSIILPAKQILSENGYIVATVALHSPFSQRIQVFNNLDDIKKKLNPVGVEIDDNHLYIFWNKK